MSKYLRYVSTKAKSNAGLLLLIGASLPLFLVHLGTSPSPWYDEGMNTHAANTLATLNVYGTYTQDGLMPFNPAITTGPTVILPVALLFRLFDPTIFDVRLIPVVYGLVCVVALFGLAEALFGRRAGLPLTLFVLAVPAVGDAGFFLLARQVLGETASLAFILLGFLLWNKSWRSHDLPWAILAGLGFGLGSISKLQSAIAVMPMLLIMSPVLARSRQNYEKRSVWTAPLVAFAILVAWVLVQVLGQSPSFRLETNTVGWEGIRTLILTGFWNRQLTPGGIAIALGTIAGGLAGAASTFKAGSPRAWGEREHTLLAVALMVIVHWIWYVGLSIGWTRYGYLGWILAILLLAGLAWQGLFVSGNRSPGSAAHPWIRVENLVIVMLTAAMALANRQFFPLGTPTETEKMAQFIADELRQNEILESWEWEIDAFSSHQQVSHPPQSLLLEAIRQRFIDHRPFDLEYDFQASEPDYVLIGPFAEWIRIYEENGIQNTFVQVRTIGAYTLWRHR